MIDYNERKKNPSRSVRHGLDEVHVTCRACNFSEIGMENVVSKGRNHLERTGHTVDVYRTHHTEITKYQKKGADNE